jgi:hypothetical protein
MFILVFILYYFDLFRKNFIEINISDYISSGILSQKNNQDILYPIVFISKKNNLIKYNYKIYNKELLVIIYCFES